MASIPVVGIVAGPKIVASFELGWQGHEWKFTVDSFSNGTLAARFDGKPMLLEEATAGWMKFVFKEKFDNDGSYEPGNCRWVTCLENVRNSRRGRSGGSTAKVMITAWGESKTIAAWIVDKRCVTCEDTLRYRLWRGWPSEKAISRPIQKHRTDRL